MSIAILFICTGKYEIFWDSFYNSCKEFFYPQEEKEFFVFTESERIIKSKYKDVQSFYQIKTGWPYDTLLRFQWFMTIQDKLSHFDYCYFFNANTAFSGIIRKDIIPFPDQKEPLIFWCHPRAINDFTGDSFHPERNPLSTAYVEIGSPCRCYGGGFFGGTSEAFVLMCKELRDNIMKDLNNGIIAIWHDQSHIIHYAITHPHKEVPAGLISEEEYIQDINQIKIIFMSKSRFGGNDSLREISTFKQIKNKTIHLIFKLFNKIKTTSRCFFQKKSS